jgi:hypothetical protein
MDSITITSAQYVSLTEDSSVNDHIEAVIDGETMRVPLDPANRHYAAILEWVADGNTIQDAD